MYKNDFVLRLLDEFGKFMRALAGLKQDEEFKQAEVALNEALKKFTQTDLEYLLSFEPDDLLIELSEKRKFNHDQLQITAELLYQDVLLKQAQNISGDFKPHYERSYALYKFLHDNQQGTFSMEILRRVQLLGSLLSS